MRSWVEVSLGQIRANYRAVRNVVGAAADVMAVVKADAYRMGENCVGFRMVFSIFWMSGSVLGPNATHAGSE